MIFKKDPIISLHGVPVLLFTQQHRTLLSALEHKNVPLFSECRNGFCGACKTKIRSGQVKYITPPLATLEIDECLPCCCIPDSNLDLAIELNNQVIIQK